jgi:hypothetical protein
MLAMRAVWMAGFALLVLAAPSVAVAQGRHDPLTPAEAEEVRESTELPVNRVKLYMRFIDERTSHIAELSKDQLLEHKGLKLHDAIDQLTYLSDELQNNLDEYEGYETNQQRPVPDLRKVLPELQKSVGVWHSILAALPANEDYDFVLETANSGLDSLKDQTAEMIASQAKYFAEKRKRDKEQEKKGDGGYVLP